VPALALALAAMTLVAGGTELVMLGVGRWAVDASPVTATSTAVFLWHRRHDGRATTG
jgi:glucose dehydrogenase